MSLRTSEYKYIALDDRSRPVLVDNPRFPVRNLVMAYLAHQGTVEELAEHFEGLTPAQVHGALVYYYDHKAEIDADIRRVNEVDQEFRRRQQKDPVVQELAHRMRKLKASRQP